MKRGIRIVALVVVVLAVWPRASGAVTHDPATRAIQYVRALLARDYGAIYDSLAAEAIADLGALDRPAFSRLAPRIGLVPKGYPSLDSVVLVPGKVEIEPGGNRGKVEVTVGERAGTESGSIWVHMARDSRGWLVCEPDNQKTRLFLGARIVALPLTSYERLRQKGEWSELPGCFTRTGAVTAFGERLDAAAVRGALDKEEAARGRFVGLAYYWEQIARHEDRATLPIEFVYLRPTGRRFVRLKVTLVRDSGRGEWLIDALERTTGPDPAELFPDLKDARDETFLRLYALAIQALREGRWDVAISEAQLVLADRQPNANQKAFGHLLVGDALFENAFREEGLRAADAEFGRVLTIAAPGDNGSAYRGTALRFSGEARLGMGDYAGAADRWSQLLTDYPALKVSENSVLALVGALSKSGRSGEVAQVLAALADNAPGTGAASVALQELAASSQRAGDVKRAREAYLRLIQQFPGTPMAENAQQQLERLEVQSSPGRSTVTRPGAHTHE